MANSGDTRVPYFKPDVGAQEADRVADCLRSGWLTSGPVVAEFERLFAAAVGADYAVALNSATAALHLSLLANDIGFGDEVVIPTMTFAAGAEVVLAAGATPVFCDVDPVSLSMTTETLAPVLTSRTRAVMPMHYGGTPCDIPALAQMARAVRPDCVVLDDAAHAFPAIASYGPVGSLSDGSAFSFYANKTITTGEGGMFTTPHEKIADRVRRLSLHGLSGDSWNRFETRSPWDYDIVEAGWKYNMTDIAAAMGIAQLDRAEKMAAARRSISVAYDMGFASLDGVTPINRERRCESACHLYVLRIDPKLAGVTRDDVIDGLRELEIGSSVHYRPLHMHSFYRDRFDFRADDYPNAAAAFTQIVSLPLFPAMTDTQRDVVIDAVNSIVGR